jgi:hypothetical protein
MIHLKKNKLNPKINDDVIFIQKSKQGAHDNNFVKNPGLSTNKKSG